MSTLNHHSATTPSEIARPNLEEELLYLAEADIERFSVLFKGVRNRQTEAVTRACMRHLAERGLDAAGKRMQIWLAGGTAYLNLLLDPDFLPSEKAAQVARMMRDASFQFVVNLQREIAGSGVADSVVPLGQVVPEILRRAGRG